MDVYKYSEYRILVSEWERSQSTRGTRSRLARAAHCSPSWMTRVLTGSVQLTPDQALGLAAPLHLNEAETDYFLLLVDLERAATAVLKKRIQRKLDALKKEGRKIAASIETDSSVPAEASVRYYSSWIYAAVHVACMIEPQDPENLCRLLFLAEGVVVRSLKDLREMGLLDLESGCWKANSKNVHLPAEHPMAKLIHSIWRNRTIQYLQEPAGDGLHYSAVHCLAKSDFEVIHKTLRDMILKCRKIIHDSPSEALYVLGLDWYKL